MCRVGKFAQTRPGKVHDQVGEGIEEVVPVAKREHKQDATKTV
jgi:hypothetical protein